MRNTTKALTALAAVLLLIPSSGVLAQRRRGLVDVSPASERHGFWINFSGGAGAENWRFTNEAPSGSCSRPVGAYQCEDNWKPSVALGLGGTVNPNLRLGGEINAWIWSHNDNTSGAHVTSYLASAMLVGQFYPISRLGAFVKGGLGISQSGEDFYGPDDISETGFAYLLGAGYEIKLSRSIFLTPAISLLHHVSTNPDDVDNLGTFHERVLTVGIGITIQPGR